MADDRGRRSGLEFLGTLAGGLVHEIKNPLSTLRINLTFLKEDLQAALPEERRLLRRIDVLEQEVRRLDAVLDDFMRYAGMRRLRLEPTDLAGVVAEVVDFVRPGFERDGVELTAELAAMEVALDRNLFKQALLNVLLNAQQAIERGGAVRLRAAREDDSVVLTVEDDGCGIPAAEQGKVFEVYYSRSRSGSGLGLPTARRILEEHGGGVELSSEEGRGTVVRLVLPVS